MEDRNEQASKDLSTFSKLVRSILEHSERKNISLKEELELLDLYVKVETNRYKEEIDCRVVTDLSNDPEDILVPTMILQPIVENAIWHGLIPKEKGDKTLELNITERDKELVLEVIDNGIGRSRSAEINRELKSSHRSMAMDITKRRLRSIKLNGRTGQISIEDLQDPTGTKVTVQIPLA